MFTRCHHQCSPSCCCYRHHISPTVLRCRLIKIDTEGMEAEVLQGAAKTIKQFKPAIYYKAVYDEEANILSPKTQAAAKFVKKMNYDQYWHFSRRFVDDNYFGNTDNVFGDTSDLCVALTRPLFYVPSALRWRTPKRTHTLNPLS